jgi:hypothetical protein
MSEEDVETAEAVIEKEQVEWVFGLTGGELSDEPWLVAVENHGEEEARTFVYWYEGVPEYAAEDHKDRFDEGVQYRTIVKDCSCLVPMHEKLRDEQGEWVLVRTFSSSGETECPAKNDDETKIAEKKCLLCDADPGDEHGFIYLGDGWLEAIYRNQEEKEEDAGTDA